MTLLPEVPENGAIARNPCHMKLNKYVSIGAASVVRPLPGGAVCGNLPPNDGREPQGAPSMEETAVPDTLDRFLLSGLVKGVPPGVAPFSLGEIGAKGWNLLREDLPLPAAVLKSSAIDHNDRWMQAFLKLSGAQIARFRAIFPHDSRPVQPLKGRTLLVSRPLH